MKIIRNIFLVSLIFFVSLTLYCSSKNGWLPLVHGPYYFSIAKSLFHYNEINHFAIYPPVQSLVYTLQIGISFFEYLIFFISEKYWYIIFYLVISIIWVIFFEEFLNFKTKLLSKTDKYLLFTILFLQPYNLNQLGNFSNEALYFPLLLYFYFSFFRLLVLGKANNLYWFIFSIFIIFGIYFRLHHSVLCINFFIFSVILKNKKISTGLIFLGIVNVIVFYLVIKNTYLDTVFSDHLNYFNNSIPSVENFNLKTNLSVYLEKFFIIITYPFLLTKFTDNNIIYYLVGLIVSSLMFHGYRNMRKENNIFNLYNLIFFSLSTIFVLLLPPFEYSYVLPFSFIIFIYSFLGFKNLIPKFYKIFFKITLALGIVFIIINYLFINSSLIEGHEYRKFVQLLKKNYIQEQQNRGVFYLADDAHDHFEDFYWQNKNKEPFCQLKKVSISECMKVQKKDNDIFIYIIGKNLEQLTKHYGIYLKENFNLEEDINPFIKKLLMEFNKEASSDYVLDRIKKEQYFYYILLRKKSLIKDYVIE